MLGLRLALLHLSFCLLLTLAVSRSIKEIDVPALFKKHSTHAELGDALRQLKGRILSQGDGEDHLEFAVQVYKLGRASEALVEFRQAMHSLFALCSDVSSSMQRSSCRQSQGRARAALARQMPCSSQSVVRFIFSSALKGPNQCVIFCFREEGVSVLRQALRIMPSLNEAWNKLAAV